MINCEILTTLVLLYIHVFLKNGLTVAILTSRTLCKVRWATLLLLFRMNTHAGPGDKTSAQRGVGQRCTRTPLPLRARALHSAVQVHST